MGNSSEVNWPDSIWKEINDGVVKEINKVRVAQKVFATTLLDNDPQTVPNEVINFKDLSIKQGQTKPLVEMYIGFYLMGPQVTLEADQKTCRTLAKMAAKVLALAEDKYFFQTSDKGKVRGKAMLPGGVEIENWRETEDLGLLAEANPDASRPADASDEAARPTSTR